MRRIPDKDWAWQAPPKPAQEPENKEWFYRHVVTWKNLARPPATMETHRHEDAVAKFYILQDSKNVEWISRHDRKTKQTHYWTWATGNTPTPQGTTGRPEKTME